MLVNPTLNRDTPSLLALGTTLRRALPTLVFMLVPFLTAISIYSCGLESRAVTTRGEAREALVVKAILEQDNYLTPLRNGIDVPSKPPMFHWLAAGTAEVYGELTELTLRLPSVLCASGTLALLALFIYLNTSSYTLSILSTLILASSFEFCRSATHARVDMCFSFFLSIAYVLIFTVFKRWHEDKTYTWQNLLLLTLALSGAALSKGPAGLLMPAFCVIMFFAFSERKHFKQSFLSLPLIPILICLCLTIFIPATWYWLAFLDYGNAFLDRHFFHENVSRLMSVDGISPGHEKPCYFSVIHLLIGFMPWSLLLPLLGYGLWTNRQKLWQQSFSLELFLGFWVLSVVIPVMLISSKREVYLLPSYPALALLLAKTIFLHGSNNKKAEIWLRIVSPIIGVSAFVLVLLASILLGFFFTQTTTLPDLVSIPAKHLNLLNTVLQFNAQAPLFLFLMFLSGGLLVSSALLYSKRLTLRASYLLGISALMLTTGVNGLLLPWDAARKDPRAFMELVKSTAPANLPLLAYKESLWAPLFYYPGNIPVVDHIASENKPIGYVITTPDHLPELKQDIPSAEILTQTTQAVLYGKTPLLLLHYNTDVKSES